jgi:hypothetical protein
MTSDESTRSRNENPIAHETAPSVVEADSAEE